MGSTGLSTSLPGIDHFDIDLDTRNCITNTQKPVVARERKRSKRIVMQFFSFPGEELKKAVTD